MKKTLTQWLAACALASLTTFAAATTLPSTPYTINAVLPVSSFVKAAANNKSYAPATDIAVINYTGSTVILDYPIYVVLSPLTFTRVTNDTFSGATDIHLIDAASGITIFDRYEPNHASIEIRSVNGQYVIIDTPY